MMHPEILVVVFFVLLTTFGVFRRNRIFFNLGYFLYGLSVFARNQSIPRDSKFFSPFVRDFVLNSSHLVGAE